MKKRIVFLCVLVIFCFSILGGCGDKNTMKDGFYTAEMSEFSHGWKEYVCILVKNDVIVSAEFNAKDTSGFIKAWDNEYMRNMGTVNGTYPNEYTREYVAQLIEKQQADGIDTVTGATSSGNNFIKLVDAVIGQAIKGDYEVVTVSE